MTTIENKLPFLLQKPLFKKKAWIETAALTAVVPGFGFLIDGSDPFFLNSSFPWVILAPLLLCLQYGLPYGMTSAGCFIATLSAGAYFQWGFIPTFPTTTIVGMLLTTMIAGEFYDLWHRRQGKLEQDHQYLKVRMEEFTRIYQALKASHTRLEQQLSSQTKSLRTSLLLLEKQIFTIQQKPGELLDDIGKLILELFREHTSIYAASIFAINSQKLLTVTPVACIGDPTTMQLSNPLIQQALNTRKVASVQNHSKETQGALVAIPLVDVFDTIWGLIVVTEMPFFALNSNALDLLAVIGGRIGDLLNRRAKLQPPDDVWKDIELVLRRNLIEIRQHKNSATITAIKFTSPAISQLYIPKLLSESRGLDKVWICENQFGHQIAIQLMPLTDSNGINSFFDRLGLPVSGNNTEDSTDSNLSIHQWILNADLAPNEVLSELYQHCQINHTEKDSHAQHKIETEHNL